MTFLWILIGLCVGTVMIVELVLWRLFVRRVRSLLLARELDASSFGLWTIGRLRLFAILHCLLLSGATALFLFSIW